ncbi:fatty acid cistrans isomerase [Nitrosococcus halophilus Nc 4]|uniref:Fatty acid cistrans isomerase n=1 Tax=Nitrosococcus halophilus (strain Nc4) TaxID=472759 RepID=D5BYI7_NITHN|nr:fatty acid cis/trans isomerase [Nitrosococcus halophilus]ADE15975.1 fatty acid cistrans isomerase [Nitrosococcus halophilus Nc 4]
MPSQPLWVLPKALLCLLLLTLSAYAETNRETPSYQKHIFPIFEQKCVACHSCYDAPCQLKLKTSKGLDRGASKQPVYNGIRTEAVEPTRLTIDANSTAGWRDKGFFSVIDGTEGPETSLLYRMLLLGRSQSFEPNSKLPEDIKLGLKRENVCPTSEEFNDYAKHHPYEGMPLATTGLTDEELTTIRRWLQAGAPQEPPKINLSEAEQSAINQWEALLNKKDNRSRLVARWLYEHLFLAHLYFEDHADKQHFFELVRSYTPPGEPIKIVATRRPNDAPKNPFWYRLRPLIGTIVHKSHITYPLSEKKLNRVNKLFFSDSWRVEQLPDYSDEGAANPFATFAAIPPRARYQFMLDNAEYFVRTFIRGPVCRGQFATDVIRDHFWTFFQDPDHDLYLTDDDYQAKITPLLTTPGQNGDLLSMGPQWLSYQDKRNNYLGFRQQAYLKTKPQGPSLKDIWNGDGHNSNAALTVFRHFDNSSVKRGLLGAFPKTVWIMDYPLFERSYYELVVNFDVFGNVSHQLQTRLYFDLIRNGAEQNFLRWLPPQSREQYLNDWYQDTGQLKLFLSYASIDKTSPTAVAFHSQYPKKEFLKQLLPYLGAIAGPKDVINRCSKKECRRTGSSLFAQRVDKALTILVGPTAKDLPVINFLPEMSLLCIYSEQGEREIYSLVRNRMHTNVAFIAGEKLRYLPERDTLTISPGILGSYPNFAFNIAEKELGDFVSALNSSKDEESFTQIIERWGIRRTHEDFWSLVSDFTFYLEETLPLEAGILDLNRYQNL